MEIKTPNGTIVGLILDPPKEEEKQPEVETDKPKRGRKTAEDK